MNQGLSVNQGLSGNRVQQVHAGNRVQQVHAGVAVALPARRRAWRRRGYHPVREMLRAARLPRLRALRWTRQPRDQLGLGRAARRANLHRALRVRAGTARRLAARGVHGVVIVDDVFTTGASVAEAVRAFRDARIPVIAVLALAYADRDAPGK